MKSIKLLCAVTAVFGAVLSANIAFAGTSFGGLTVGNTYWLKAAEYGTGSGQITQANAWSVNAAYTLPFISVYASSADARTNSNMLAQVWGVCIDTRQTSADPQEVTLQQGWAGGHGTLGTSSRMNGTAFDETAWKRSTYLFNKYQMLIGSMDNYHKAAFQLAMWEVISGDGSYADGGTWAGAVGSGNSFVAANVGNGSIALASDDMLAFADEYVRSAYDSGFAGWTGANEAFYFHDGQDFLIYAPTPPNNGPSVPEIPAQMLAPIGMAVVAAIRRRMMA